MEHSAEIELVAAKPEEQPVVANLLELYIHDLSEVFDVEIGPDGRFGYPALGDYWTKADRFAYLIRVDGRLAGFVLASREEGYWDIAEFFVVRGERRHGAGMRAAHELWRRLAGRWQVRVRENNPARDFWSRAIGEFTGQTAAYRHLEKNGNMWRVYQFGADSILSETMAG